MKELMLSCDWGTSSFRLKLVEIIDSSVIGALSSDEGAAVIYDQWKAEAGGQEAGREAFYLQKLGENIDTLSERLAIPLAGIPVIMSGMIASSIGIRALPYAALPFAMDGRGAIVQKLSGENDYQHPVWMISGVSDREDIMRGEETQLIGLADMDREMSSAETSVCILPGTHSKHIQLQNGCMTGFKTFMTGELFHVLRHHSILKNSLAGNGDEGNDSDAERNAFCRGLDQSQNGDLLHTMFSLRVNELMGRSSKTDNFFQLSGLLIGTELKGLCDEGDLRIRLCSGSALYPLYRLAIEAFGLLSRTVLIPPDIMEASAAAGHARIFKNFIR